MSTPFHILKHEHRIIERVLRALEGVCLRIEAGYRVPAEALVEIVAFITTFADTYHHGKEEKYLFPALDRRGITREGGPLGAIECEHRLERNLIGDLEHAIELYEDGDGGQGFALAARAYVMMLVGHIEKEDSVLFRIGDEVLDDVEKRDLAASLKKADAALGERTLQDYERLASELEERWAL